MDVWYFRPFFLIRLHVSKLGGKIIGWLLLLLLNDLILNSTSGGILDSSRLGSQLFFPRASELT